MESNWALLLKSPVEDASGGSDVRAIGPALRDGFQPLPAEFRLPPVKFIFRGGLAAWQKRVVAEYIELHLAGKIALSELAQLAHLSPFHFARAFKQSFGQPPHRYHLMRRIEGAKTCLAKTATSVTAIGMTLGFSDTSAFTATFRKLTGLTPTGYRRTYRDPTSSVPSSAARKAPAAH